MTKRWEREHIVLEVYGRSNKEMKALQEWLEEELCFILNENYTEEAWERAEVLKRKAKKQLRKKK